MKKLLLFFFLLFASASMVFSQTSGGPDAFGYTWRDNNDAQGPVYNWIDITTLSGAVQVAGLGDDNTVGFYNLGFQFPYYWYSVSHFKIGSNGYIDFSGGAMSAPFDSIPNVAHANDLVAPFMSDLYFGGAGNVAECWYWTNTVDTLIVSYIHVPFWVNGVPFAGDNTFQVILSKVDSSITFQYQLQQGTVDPNEGSAPGFMSIGIENNSGTVGLQPIIDTYPTPSYAIKFYYPQATSFIVNDGSTTYCDNPGTGGRFISKNGAHFTMNAQVANTGNQSLSPFNVNMKVLNATNVVQVQETLATSALIPGQTEDLTASSTFNPTTAGTYRFITTTLLAGDATPTNNVKTLELRVVDTTAAFVTLGYTGATANGTVVSWAGGDAGAGVEIIPPYYPCYIRRVEFFITANPLFSNFYSLIYDNTGPNSTPGNLLDSTFVSSGDINTQQWNSVELTSPIQVDSGSIFVGWIMNGEQISLGTDATAPISNRSYEVLGSWSTYRDGQVQDPMIRMVISASPTAGTDNQVSSESVGEFYPSPSDGKIRINYRPAAGSKESIFNFYDLQGKLVESSKVVHSSGVSHQVLSFDLSNLDAGLYICKIMTGDFEYNKKLVIK